MTTDTVVRAGWREWVGLAVLALPALLLSLDISVLFLALPHLSADLGAGSIQQLWIMDIYGFMLAGLLVTMGTLGDRIGRRRLLLVGAVAFGAASVLAAYSSSAEMLIATRALLGIAGATLAPSILALISTMFTDPRQRALGISVFISCFMGGSALGPVVGGALLEWFWWGSVFLLGVPAMVVLLVAGPMLLPEYRDSDAGRLDLTSVGLSMAAILPVVYGLKELASGGWQPPPLVAIVAGVAFGVVFVRRQRTLTSPLLDLRLFSNRSFSATLAVMLLGGVVIGGIYLLVSQYVQVVADLSPLQAGLWLAPSPLAFIVGSLLAPVIARRIRPAYVMAGGLALSAIGFLVLSQVPSTDGLAVVVVGFVIVFFGGGPSLALGTGLVLGSAPPEKAGSASSVSETSGELGIALGVAAIGSIGTAVYRSRFAVPAEAPSAAAETARESIAGAASAAQQLPAALGAELLEAAGEAFTTGLNTAAGLGAALYVVLAVIAATVLRHVRPIGEADPTTPAAAPRLEATGRACKSADVENAT